MSEVDVLFVVDALPKTGFGHAARCASVARLLRRQSPQLRIGFQGVYSDTARKLLAHHLEPGFFHEREADIRSRVAVIDRMHDIQDADSWDPQLLERVRGQSGQVVHLTSGPKDPGLPEDVTCIGFQPGGPPSHPPRLYWGLEYAPVSLALESPEVQEPPVRDRLLVALGGARDASGIELAMNALELLPQITRVDVLGSPVNDPALLDAARCKGVEIEIHTTVRDVAPLLRRARVVLASYGHLVYEALARGAAACVVGQKHFQAEFAGRLAGEGLVISGGYAPDTDAQSLAAALERTWDEADTLSARGRKAVDGHGLERIADMLLGKLGRAA